MRTPSDLAANKLLGLEFIRFLCALAVLFWHYQHFAFQGVELSADFQTSAQPFFHPFRLFYEQGFRGVPIFWCISGFIFFWKYRDPIAARAVSARNFVILRFSRLYPLHLATLLLVAVLQVVYWRLNATTYVYANNDVAHFIAQLFMASNWGVVPGDSFNGPIWSISIEVLAYAFFFVQIRLTGRSALAMGGVLVAVLAVKALHGEHQVVDCLAYFYAGGLAAVAHQWMAASPRHRLVQGLGWAIVCLAPPVALLTGVYHWGSFPFVFLILYTPVLLYCASADYRPPAALRRVIEVAGNMTYSSYLLHFPLQMLLAIGFTLAGARIPLYSPAFFLAFLVAMGLISAWSYSAFELPAQRLLRRRLL